MHKPRKASLKIDMVGNRYGRLVVKREKKIDEYPDGRRKRVEWYCDCDCGTKDHLVSGEGLRAGKTKSCGCYQRELASARLSEDLSGQKFGKLTVIEEFKQERTGGTKKWICKCDCGNTTIVPTRHLKSSHTTSCGCISSKNEEKIIALLLNNNVKFKTQYWLDDLRNDSTGRPLRFDFAIFNKKNSVVMFIEYDGIQHFHIINFSKNLEANQKNFENQQKCDDLKNDYCRKNGISLFRIPYKYEDEVEKLVLGALKEKGVI